MRKFKFLPKNKISLLPKGPGIYAFKNKRELFYIGKAGNIKERVKNHFSQPTFRDNLFVSHVSRVGYIKTGSEIEALLLEAKLIKKYQPKFNVVWRDDKNYFYVGITKEPFPQVFITHQTKTLNTKYKILNTRYVGPFVDGKTLKETLKFLRKVFPFRSCRNLPEKSCLWYHLDRCPAPCILKSKIMKVPAIKENLEKEAQKDVASLFGILSGKKSQVLKNLKKEMGSAAKSQNFEKAAKLRDKISAFERVLSHAKVLEKNPRSDLVQEWPKTQKVLQKIADSKKTIKRIEAYDISNIQGKEATGSMVVFINGKPDKSQYRKFKIKIEGKPNDTAMIKEILTRRFNHPEWPFPNIILIDGGKAQLNAALNIANQHKSAKPASIRVMALAKKKNELYTENRKQPILLKALPREIFNLILQLRDEAHRFAIGYHRKLRKRALID